MTTPVSNAVSIQDYVAGRLSDTEREAFEERLLNDATLVQDLEDSLRLREGLEVLREQNLLGEEGRPRRHAFRVALAFASAAVLGVVVVSAALYFGRRSASIVAASVAALGGRPSSPLAVAERYSFAATRAETTTPELFLPSRGALELRALAPGAEAGRKFQLTLWEFGKQKSIRIGSEGHLVPDAEGFVVIYADASRLAPGEYWLSLEPETPDKSPGERFGFRLKRAPED
jgi:hypothetical protein